MLGYQYLLLLVFAISLATMQTAFAQQSPEDCDPDQVFQLGQCVDIDTLQVVVAWDKPTYKICDTGTVTVQASEENTNPNLIQIFFIQVTSDSDPVGVKVVVIETGNDSGIFVGDLQLCGDLNVSEGDYVYAEYGNIGDAARIESPPSVTIDESGLDFGINLQNLESKFDSNGRIIVNGEVLNNNNFAIKEVKIWIGFYKEDQITPLETLVGTTTTDLINPHQITSFSIVSSQELQEVTSLKVNIIGFNSAQTESSTPTKEGPGPIATAYVEIQSGTSVPGCEETFSCYSPYAISVKVRDFVTWYNDDIALHTVTSGTPSMGPDGFFDDSLESRQTFAHLFTQTGEYPYFCMLHPWQTGIVYVEGDVVVREDIVPPLLLVPDDIIVEAPDGSGEIVEYSVKAIDDIDGILIPNCSPLSGSFFSIGDTTVTCSSSDKAGNFAENSFTVNVMSPDIIIPNWIRDVAGFWCDDEIDDNSFIEAIQYLIDNDVIVVKATSSGSGISQEIPNWVKNNACWWSNGQISNNDFASGLEYLIEKENLRIKNLESLSPDFTNTFYTKSGSNRMHNSDYAESILVSNLNRFITGSGLKRFEFVKKNKLLDLTDRFTDEFIKKWEN